MPRKKKTTEEFIAEARVVHADRYDYSRVVYNGAHKKCDILCETHGAFQQPPNTHLKGKGCPACGGSVKSTTDEFIEKARNLHGDQYNYSQLVYVNNSTKCEIVCKTHGVFRQTPNAHLSGRACPQCGIVSAAEKQAHTLLTFVIKAESVHGDKYDYRDVRYTNTYTPCGIRCKIHGECKKLTPNNHLGGAGCPRCNESKGEKEVAKLLTKYNLKFKEQKRFKGLRYKRPLNCDFYVPEINTVIEYQGRHHYGIGIHAERDTEGLCQIRDQIKRDFCKANGIHLIEIPYWENTETYLRDALLPILRLYPRKDLDSSTGPLT